MAALQFPWDIQPVPVVTSVPADEQPPPSRARSLKPKPRGRRPATRFTTETAPNWLYHHLTISGADDIVASFAAAARGAGVTPWQLDFADIEEDIFVRAVSQPVSGRNLTVEGCRILARQFRERVEVRQAQAVALVGHSLACPFDLHVLLPVPGAILELGPIHPTARAWLATHWGVTGRLRQVAVRDKATTGRPSTRGRGRLSAGQAVIGYGFFTLGETPHVAITQLAARWPALRFQLMPRPTD
jgi:hypothetical protein